MKIKQNFDLNKVYKYANWNEDSGRYFIYSSLTAETIKILNIWKTSRQIEIINGNFNKATKIIEQMKKDRILEHEQEQMTLFEEVE